MGALLLLALLAPTDALAFECSHSKEHCFVSLFWPTRDIGFNVEVPEDSSISQAEMESAVDAAMARWNEIDCSDIRLFRTSEATPNRIAIVTQGWDPKKAGAAGLTDVRHEVTTGEIRDSVEALGRERLTGVILNKFRGGVVSDGYGVESYYAQGYGAEPRG